MLPAELVLLMLKVNSLFFKYKKVHYAVIMKYQYKS